MTAGDQSLSLGFSPCPNDTFIFNALVNGQIDTDPIHFLPPAMEDVETLNHWALEGRLDVTKISFHVLGHVSDTYVLLGAGAALGRGCGPLLVAAKPHLPKRADQLVVAIPGQYTTAAMLLRLFAPEIGQTVAMPFDRIMDSVAGGEVDAGVIIHESRFTYPRSGLSLVQDLGSWWAEETGRPIPLGGIVGRRSLGEAALRKVEEGIRASVRAALATPGFSRPFVKAHAQELEDDVIDEHIRLYVNRFSENLGEEGRAAVEEFLRRGSEADLFPRMAVMNDVFLPVA